MSCHGRRFSSPSVNIKAPIKRAVATHLQERVVANCSDSRDGLAQMSQRHFRCRFAFSRRDAPELLMNRPPKEIRGRRECRVRAAPAVSCAKMHKETHTSIQVQTEQSGIPCTMVLRLISCSPRRRIRFVTVADGLKDCLNPVGSTLLRQLDTSNGCQDHTALPYAASPVVCALCSLTDQSPPCEHDHAPDAAASTASRPNVRDDGQRPSNGTGWRKL
jgi:hypothetical protein